MEVNDCISRADVLQILLDYDYANENALVIKDIKALPSVTPQEPVKKLEKQIKQLQNRCHALTHGQICVFCPYECEHKAESEE